MNKIASMLCRSRPALQSSLPRCIQQPVANVTLPLRPVANSGLLGGFSETFQVGPAQGLHARGLTSTPTLCTAASHSTPQQPDLEEVRLIELAGIWEEAIQEKMVYDIEGLIADDVIVHKDNISLYKDLHGKHELKRWVKAYFDKYDYRHEVVDGAVANDRRGVFSFWHDANVTPKPDKFTEDLPEWAKEPSDTIGMWYWQVATPDPIANSVTDTWFLRQLSNDEVYRKLQYQPHQLRLDVQKYRGSPWDASPDQRQAMQVAAELYNDMWATGNTDLADAILTSDVYQADPVLGKERVGINAIKALVRKFHREWEITPGSHRATVGTGTGNKAFTHWVVLGKSKVADSIYEKEQAHPPDEGNWVQAIDDTNYGLDMLVFNKDLMITDIIGFRSPTRDEARMIVKPELLDAAEQVQD